MKYGYMLAISQLDNLAKNTNNELFGLVFGVATAGAVAGLLIANIPSLKKLGIGMIVAAFLSVLLAGLIEGGLLESIRGLV